MIVDGFFWGLGALLGVAAVATATVVVYLVVGMLATRIRYTRLGWWLWRRRWPSQPERW